MLFAIEIVVYFVLQSRLPIQIFIQLRLLKARISFDFLFVVNRVHFRPFCKTEIELTKNLGVILKFRRF